ncbi:hypothetical protein [Nocardia pseudobrasiliensis]|uniref:hypothetical protein n=1 Tax=Nocardia pseudobrasiliensis TaxID=45979 RepID=UPI00157DACED|nr:hypothetical protein [Nocardia pseudobrasiliensis]
MIEVAVTSRVSAIRPDAGGDRSVRAVIREHPRAWKNLRAIIERATGAPVDTLPMVRVRLEAR